MTSPHPALEAWAEWWRRLDALRSSLNRIKGMLVSSSAVRDEAKEAVQFYFRQVRLQLAILRFDDEQVDTLDRITQHILELAARPNRKSTYQGRMRELNGMRGAVEA